MPVTNVNLEVRTIGGVSGVEVDTDKKKATPNGIKTFFGPPPIGARELMDLKKKDGVTVTDGNSDYDQIARGIFDESLTY